MRKQQVFLFLFALFYASAAFTQGKDNKEKHRVTLLLQFGNQRVGMPFKEILKQPRHVYIGVGAERIWKSKGKLNTYQTIHIGVFENNASGNGYFVLSNYGYQYNVTSKFFLSGEAGLGFTHIFRPTSVYQLEPDGSYKHITDRGKIHPDINFNLRFGYQPKKIGVFLNYNIFGEFLYSRDLFVYPQTLISTGIRYKI